MPAALDSGAPRLSRAVLLAGSTVGLGAAAHVLGHGTVPSLPTLLVLAAALLPVAVLLTARPLRPVTALVALLGGQLTLHHVFTVLAACAPGAVPSAHADHLGPVSPAAAAGCHGLHGVGVGDGRSMLVFHLVATAGTALLLAAGDGLLWRLSRRLLARLPRLAHRPVLAVATPRAGAERATRVSRPLPWVRPPRRGPPAPRAHHVVVRASRSSAPGA